jgi:hypothetical protein
MAFCTSCGAQVKGAFCEQCGTPVSAASGTAAAAPPPTTPQPPVSYAPPSALPPPAAPPTKAKVSPIVWILVAVLGFIVLGFIGLVGTGLYLARNPGMVLGKLITAANPDAEVVSTDSGAKTITIRDRKTGEEVTVSFDDVKNGRFKMTGIGKHGEIGNIEIGGGAGKTPSWVPTYPGAKAMGNFTAQGDDGSGRGVGGVVTFESSDAPEKVTEFYKDKIGSMGLKIVSTFDSPAGGMLVAHDDDDKRTLQVTIGKTSAGGTSIGVTYGEKR